MEELITDPKLRSLAANLLIERCHIKSQYAVSREYLQEPERKQYIEEFAEQSIYAGIVNELKKYNAEIVKEASLMEIVYSLEFYIFEPKYFKLILEEFVRKLSDEQIKQIRNI